MILFARSQIILIDRLHNMCIGSVFVSGIYFTLLFAEFPLQILKEKLLTCEDLIATVSTKLPNYNISLQLLGSSYVVGISQLNQAYQYDAADADDIATLLVGDSNNRLLLYKKL